MDTEKKRSSADLWLFSACILMISFFVNWMQQARQTMIWVTFAPFAAGILAFLFQTFYRGSPLIRLYSKNHPYRKLKPYGVVSAFLLFEFVLGWGLYTKQILIAGEDLFLITLVFIGAIAYYYIFIRMKISLRFLFLAILIPVITFGTALGLGSYFKILRFATPTVPIGDIVFFNTIYWILFHVFLQTLCEEPAFRGYLMQRLQDKGESFAIMASSLIYAIWRISFVLFSGAGWDWIVLIFAGNFIIGAIFALLFIKGRNLLLAILCHGIIEGLSKSFFASSANPGIRQYIEFLVPGAESQLRLLWFGCLFAGLILLSITPRKKTHVG